jgi:hypothetical protein
MFPSKKRLHLCGGKENSEALRGNRQGFLLRIVSDGSGVQVPLGPPFYYAKGKAFSFEAMGFEMRS